jgi:hypothetical protein
VDVVLGVVVVVATEVVATEVVAGEDVAVARKRYAFSIFCFIIALPYLGVDPHD